MLLSEFNILEPDLVYLSNERSHFLTSKNLQDALDLAVEILSRGTQSRDERLKRDVYERAGVKEYWVVDPDKDVVEVYRRPDPTSALGPTFSAPDRFERTQILSTPLLPGLELSLDKILA